MAVHAGFHSSHARGHPGHTTLGLGLLRLLQRVYWVPCTTVVPEKRSLPQAWQLRLNHYSDNAEMFQRISQLFKSNKHKNSTTAVQ